MFIRYCIRIVTIKLSSKNSILFHPFYKRLVWRSPQANNGLIKRAIELFDWKKVLLILTSINSFLFLTKWLWIYIYIYIYIYNKYFILHETITCTDKDPPWMSDQIKALIGEKSPLYNHLKRRILNSKLLNEIAALQAKLQSSINFFNLNTTGKCKKKYLIHSLVLNAIGLY